MEDPEKTTDLSQVIDKLYHIMLYTSPWSRFELTTSVVTGTDFIGSCKSNFHTITATTASQWMGWHQERSHRAPTDIQLDWVITWQIPQKDKTTTAKVSGRHYTRGKMGSDRWSIRPPTKKYVIIDCVDSQDWKKIPEWDRRPDDIFRFCFPAISCRLIWKKHSILRFILL